MARHTKQLEPRPCQRCAAAVLKLTRIQHDASGRWLLVCDACWPDLSRDNPHYTYGGVWRAAKRR